MNEMKDNTEEHDIDPNDAIERKAETALDESKIPNSPKDGSSQEVEGAECVGDEWCEINLNDFIEETQGDEQK